MVVRKLMAARRVGSQKFQLFTTNLHNHDGHANKRTTAWTVLTVIHEAGHGIYELGIKGRPDIYRCQRFHGMYELPKSEFFKEAHKNFAFWVLLL